MLFASNYGPGLLKTTSVLNPVIPGIDVLRGVAILMVVVHHYYLAVNSTLLDSPLPYVPGLTFLAEHGYLGVKLFFVISGFCIHCSYLRWCVKHPASSTRKFWPEFLFRRFFRIIPPYVVALLIFWGIQYLPNGLQIRDLKHLAVHGLLVQNMKQAFFFNINPSFWSIAVEWQLYLIYPIFLVLLNRNGSVVSLLFAAFTTVCIQQYIPEESYAIRHSPFAYWLQWVCGAILAQELSSTASDAKSYVRRINPTWLAAIGVPSMIWLFLNSVSPVTKNIASTMAMFLLVWASLKWRCEGLFCKIFIAFGIASYSLYLLHQPLLSAFELLPTSNPGIYTYFFLLSLFLLYLSVAYGLARFFYVLIEEPSIRVGKKYWASTRLRLS